MSTRDGMICPYSEKCGGCSLWNQDYEEQMDNKYRQVNKLLKDFGEVPPVIGMGYPYHYRNKVHAVFGPGKKGQILCGVYEKNSHRIVDVESCLIEDKISTAIIRDIKELMPSFKIKPYNEDSGYGLLRHVLVRRGFSTGEVMGVELNYEAVGDAIQNAKQNKIKNERFLCADATEYIVDVAKMGEHFDVVFMDPPRAGSTKAFVEALVELAPERVVYISCNPETLARDLKWFDREYQVEQIQPYDMFPFTDHVESVVLLNKVQNPITYLNPQ